MIWTTRIPRVMDGSALLLAVVCAWRAVPVPGYWERALGGQWANYDDVSG